MRLKRIKCAAMEGLVEEGKEVIDSIDEGPLRDAALIGGAEKVEHYEIAAYGTLMRSPRMAPWPRSPSSWAIRTLFLFCWKR